jgi:plastocyanin
MAAAVMLLAPAACGGADKTATETSPAISPAQSTAVAIQTFQFQPSPVEVKVGARITWLNRDDIQHTVTAGTPDGRSGRFDLPLSGKDSSATFTFSEPGTYPYFCARHESMRGEVRVTS